VLLVASDLVVLRDALGAELDARVGLRLVAGELEGDLQLEVLVALGGAEELNTLYGLRQAFSAWFPGFLELSAGQEACDNGASVQRAGTVELTRPPAPTREEFPMTNRRKEVSFHTVLAVGSKPFRVTCYTRASVGDDA